MQIQTQTCDSTNKRTNRGERDSRCAACTCKVNAVYLTPISSPAVLLIACVGNKSEEALKRALVVDNYIMEDLKDPTEDVYYTLSKLKGIFPTK